MEKSYEQQFWNLQYIQYVLLPIWMLFNKKKKKFVQY